jgi:peptidoglycan/LPS O-acetylase OafA/YrhL
MATVGVLLSGAGLFVAIAIGMPALGLNPHGTNPAQFTVTSELTAAFLYFLGALLSWLAAGQMRRLGNVRRLLPAGVVIGVLGLVVEVPTVLQRDWAWAGGLLFFYAGLFLPIALGLRPWEPAPSPVEQKPAA